MAIKIKDKEAVDDNNLFWKQNRAVTTDLTVGADTTRNTGSFGPMEVADGVTVTVAENGQWTIV